MTDILSQVKKKLSRLFLGRIVVRELAELHREEGAKIEAHRRTIDIIPMRTEPRVSSALFVKWRQTKAKSAGAILSGSFVRNFKVHKIQTAIQQPGKVKRYKLTIKRRAAAKNALGRIRRLPILRKNRLSFLKKQMKFERATLLALFSPIFQEKVAKSALDKGSGNLFIWYDNDRVKSGEKYHLLLLRVFGGEEPLKWVWLPADKKIN
jgi:hypothetical protein